MIWSTSLEKITHSASQFPTLIRRLSRRMEQFAAASEKAETAATNFHQQADDTSQALDAGVGKAKELLQEIDHIRTLPADCPDAINPHVLTRVDVRHMMHLSGIWLIIATLAVAVVGAISYSAVRATLPNMTNAASVFVGLGIVLPFLVLGALVPRGDILLGGTGARRVIVSGSPWGNRAAVGMGIVITVLLALIVSRTRMSKYSFALWIVVYLAGAGSAGAVSQAISLAKGLPLWLTRVGDVLRTVLESVWRLAVRTIVAVATGFEIVALAFAAPIFCMTGRVLPTLEVSHEQPGQSVRSLSAIRGGSL